MATINDLISQIENVELRERIQKEVDALSRQKKFGLVFEDHIPECTLLYDVPVQRGRMVAIKGQDADTQYFVAGIKDGVARCISKATSEASDIPVEKLVCVAQFGDPIYPYLKPIDAVCNAPDSDLWHTLIEADNYHALQLLEYLYAGKVDCIYIDPPYNTGAKDWKYNNDYVDGNDTYRHSKWLSMMEKRLKLAKKLLNPQDSVLIVTIDEKEYLHLGCLLEEIFHESNIQMVTSVVSAKGVVRPGQFSRVEEHIFFVSLGTATICNQTTNMLEDIVKKNSNRELDWLGLRRREPSSKRSARPNQFYPIFVDRNNGHIVSIGDAVAYGIPRESIRIPDDCVAIWPLNGQDEETLWGLTPDVLRSNHKEGFVRVKNWNKKKQTGTVYYLPGGTIADIRSGIVEITGYRDDGSIIGTYHDQGTVPPKRVWNVKTHNAETFGTNTLAQIIGKGKFSFPKSLYAVHDTIRFFVANKPNALVVDFFAGSGTTLHAVNLLNAEDGGNRRCILVTNNEVSADEAKSLSAKGHQPGDPEWERLGIAHYVTWPRTVCSIDGHDVNGAPLKGNYLGSDRPMSEGFKANAAFFKLGFLDKHSVAMGRQFREMLPTLWMKAGCHGPCPRLDGEEIPDMLILPENCFAVLNCEDSFDTFAEQVNALPEIETVYLVTDSGTTYRFMASNLNAGTTYQLYRDYLDNFRINTRR